MMRNEICSEKTIYLIGIARSDWAIAVGDK